MNGPAIVEVVADAVVRALVVWALIATVLSAAYLPPLVAPSERDQRSGLTISEGGVPR